MKHGWLSLVGLFLVVAQMPAAKAEAADVSYDLGFNSAYVWRGIALTDGAVFQPSISTSHGSGFGFNVWGNLDIDDVNGLGGDFQELNLVPSFSFGGDVVTAEVGLIEYLFPNGVGAGTREVYVSLGFDTVLSPSVAFYYDFDEIDSYYGTLGVEWGGELGEDWSYALGLLAGFAGDDFARITAGGTDSGLFNGEVNLSFTYEQDRWTAGGFVAYTDTLDKKVLPEQAVDVYGGFFLGFSF